MLVPSCFAIFTFEPLTLSLTSMPSCDLVSLANILQGGIPLRFWSDCVLTAVYLINRLPSLVLKVFPFKMKSKSVTESVDVDYTSDTEHLTFFDNQTLKSTMMSDGYTSCGWMMKKSKQIIKPLGKQYRSEEVSLEGKRLDSDENNCRGNQLTWGWRSAMGGKNGGSHGGLKYGFEKFVSYSSLKGSNLCFASTLNKSVEPTCLSEALSDPNWVDAMNNEIKALNRNNTWTECDLPPGRKPIGSKWIWKIKYKASGDIERYKARLVAKGFSQKEGFDYDETFSLVVKMVTIRCLVSIIVVHGWPLYQLDINNAFLYGNLVEDVYMTLPEGYKSGNKTKLCKMNKSLYGLKQALRQWNVKLTTALVEHGFEQNKFDYSLYIKHKGTIFVALLVYMDDIVITGNDEAEINSSRSF
ncbi:ribonuclease H-like domain-containing protein [Tanacetum coccineum]